MHGLDDQGALDGGPSADLLDRGADSQPDLASKVPRNARLIRSGSDVVPGNALMSPDGQRVLYQLAEDAWSWQVYDFSSETTRPISFDRPSQGSRARFRGFSPDGRYAALWPLPWSEGSPSGYIVDLERARASGLPSDCLLAVSSDVFTPDSAAALCKSRSGSQIKRIRLADGEITTVGTLPSLTSGLRYRGGAWGQKQYLLGISVSGPETEQLTVLDLDTSQVVLQVTGLPRGAEALGPTPAGWIVITGGDTRAVRLDAVTAAFEALPQLGTFLGIVSLQPEGELLLGRDGSSDTPVWHQLAIDGGAAEERPSLAGFDQLRWIGGTQLLGRPPSLPTICSEAASDCAVYRVDLVAGKRTVVGLHPMWSLDQVTASAERSLVCQGYGPTGACSGASLGDLVLVDGDQRTLLAQDVTLGASATTTPLSAMTDRALTRALAHVRYLDTAHGDAPGPANGLYVLLF